jgi:hypothetical protein
VVEALEIDAGMCEQEALTDVSKVRCGAAVADAGDDLAVLGEYVTHRMQNVARVEPVVVDRHAVREVHHLPPPHRACACVCQGEGGRERGREEGREEGREGGAQIETQISSFDQRQNVRTLKRTHEYTPTHIRARTHIHARPERGRKGSG